MTSPDAPARAERQARRPAPGTRSTDDEPEGPAADPPRPAADPPRPVARTPRRPRPGQRGRTVALGVGLVGLVAVSLVVRDSLPHHSTGPHAALAGTVAIDVNRLAAILDTSERTIGRCPAMSTADGLACVETADQQMATDLRRFSGTVARVAVPPGDRTRARRLEGVVDRLADDLDALGSTPSAQQYRAVSNQRDVQPLGATVEHAADALVSAIER